MRSLSFAASLAFPLTLASAYGQTPTANPLCDNLAKFSCAPGIYDDGTGKAFTKDTKDPATAAQRDRDEAQIQAQSLFRQELMKPEGAYFRKMAIGGLGLDAAPDCRSLEAADQEKCTNDASIGLASMVTTKVWTGIVSTGGSTGPSDLPDLDYVTHNEVFTKIETAVAERLNETLAHSEQLAHVEKDIFPEIKKYLTKRLQSTLPDGPKKTLILEKVNAIQWKAPANSCGGGMNPNGLLALLEANARYDSSSNTVTVCRGLFNNTSSEFALAFTVAHELAHSIDPCRIAEGPETVSIRYPKDADRVTVEKHYPLSGLISCLRSDKSAHARQSWAPDPSPSVGPTANPSIAAGGKPFCGKVDQIPESVADWFAADIVPEYISAHYPKLTSTQLQYGYSNVWRDLCSLGQGTPEYEEPSKSGSTFAKISDEHPPIETRINRILLVDPKVRQQLGCTSPHTSYVYCSPDSKYDDFVIKAPATPANAVSAPKRNDSMEAGQAQ